jgi:hypothetical protein
VTAVSSSSCISPDSTGSSLCTAQCAEPVAIMAKS